MEFESVSKAAERLGCTVRAVQKWAKEGKIPDAYKDGRDWKIPVYAVRPGEARTEREFLRNEPFPIIHAFAPGDALSYIDGIALEDDKNMALCEYYYFTAQFEKAIECSLPYLTSDNPILRLGAYVFYFFANLCLGHIDKAYLSFDVVEGECQSIFGKSTSVHLKAICAFASQIIATCLQLPKEHLPPMDEHIKYLDGGLRLIACYISAHNAYLTEDYSRSLGIVETALNITPETYPLPMIYLHIIEAMDYINLLDTEKAAAAIEKAWLLAESDGFVMPFAEHYNLLQGMIERHFKKKHPRSFNHIISVSKQYNNAWYELYNHKGTKEIPHDLTHTEFTIAMLYSRAWRAKEIAAHLELSERTIMNYITVIYDKLGINGKKELKRYMF